MEFSLEALELEVEVRKRLAECLRRKGWVTVTFPEEHSVARDWSACFKEVFDQPVEAKKEGGKYRSTHGISVGYKQDLNREFLECHRRTDGVVSPNYPPSSLLRTNYPDVTQSLYNLQSRVAELVLAGIAEMLELDRQVFLDLTDLSERGRLPPIQTEREFDTEFKIEDGKYQALSSSVLRICVYDAREECEYPKVMFGAHTDTSFVTMGMHCNTPGLEILDLETDEWVCPEALYPAEIQPRVTIFVGEFLQILTKQYFQAAVHRVTAFSSAVRISCPFIIRGRDEKKILFRDSKYIHPGGLNRDYIPDLDDTPFGSVHKLLDLKRNWIGRQYENDDDSEWVLAAYPVKSSKFVNSSY